MPGVIVSGRPETKFGRLRRSAGPRAAPVLSAAAPTPWSPHTVPAPRRSTRIETRNSEPAPAFEVPTQAERVQNRPGQRARIGERAELITEAAPRPPRRLGHVVIGTPDPLGTVPIYQALGFRVSDVVAGLATFMRCSPDHHNFLVAPGRVPYLNHYALEHDDFDSLARAATVFLRNHGDDRQIAGPGRHMVGGNQFWYMLDPSGSFFEFFSDMDRIEDDDAWEIRTDWDLADSWSLWGDKDQPEVFFNPPDMEEVVAGWEKQHG